jgi:hypothetical protein
MSRTLDVMGLREVSTVTGVKVVTLSAWLTRGHMPEPDARLACGPIWRASTIDHWAAGDGYERIVRAAS